MQAPNPKQVADAYSAFCVGDTVALVDLLAEDSFDNVSGRRGKEIWHVVADWLARTYGDRAVDLHAAAADGDRVLIWMTMHGTHIGSAFPWMKGRPATGRRISAPQLHVFRMSGGLIVEHWAVRDDLRVLEAIDAAD